MSDNKKLLFKNLPAEEEHEKYDEEKAKDYLSNVVRLIEEKKNIKDLLHRIKISYFIYYDFIANISDFLATTKYIECVEQLIKNNNPEEMHHIYNTLINFTSASESFARKVHKSSIFSTFMGIFLETKANDFRSVSNYLNLIHNIALNLNTTIENEQSLMEKLKEIINNKEFDKEFSKKNNILAILTLTYIVAGKEKENIESIKDIVKGSVKKLLHMIASVNKVDFRYLGFSIPCMLTGLKCLCATADLLNEFCNNGGLPMLSERLNNTEIPDDELDSILDIVLQLFMHGKESNLEENNIKIKELVERFKDNDNLIIKKHLNCLELKLWLKSEKAVVQEKCKKKYVFDVFISYSHKNKAEVLELKKLLEYQKLKIWFDETEMIGNINDCMTKGIQKSKCTVLCISKPYKESINCELEADFSRHCKNELFPVHLEFKYKQNGWLSDITRNLFYYSLYVEKDNSEALIKNLTKTIFNENAVINEVNSIKSLKKFTKSMDKIKLWSTVEVKAWLKDNNIDDIFSNELHNGESLMMLINSWTNNRKHFEKSFKRDYKITAGKLCMLVCCFEKLLKPEK